MNDLLLQILQLVIMIAIALITRYVIPWLKNNTKLAENDFLLDVANIAVRCSEQLFSDPKTGIDKKSLATEYIKRIVAQSNIKINDEQIDALIESAVYALNSETITTDMLVENVIDD